MTTETQETMASGFPVVIGDVTLNTPEELSEYQAKLQEQIKAVKQVKKETRANSPRQLKNTGLDMVVTLLNADDDVVDFFNKNFNEDTVVRCHYVSESESFVVRLNKPSGERKANPGRAGYPVVIGDTQYPNKLEAIKQLINEDAAKEAKTKALQEAVLAANGHDFTEVK